MKNKGELIEIYKKLLKGNFRGWVLFQHGTCVVIPQVRQTIQDDAIALLSKYGQVIPGTPQGDFGLVELKDHLGWVVTGSHPDILNVVLPDEVKGKQDDIHIGLIGRTKRELDGKELTILYVEKL